MIGLTTAMIKLLDLGLISYKPPHFLPGLELSSEPAIASGKWEHQTGVQGRLSKELPGLLLGMSW